MLKCLTILLLVITVAYAAVINPENVQPEKPNESKTDKDLESYNIDVNFYPPYTGPFVLYQS